VVVAASSEQQQERAQHALLAYAQPTKLTPRAKHDETGSSLGHTAPVWPAPTREIALSSRGAIRGSALWGTYSAARTEVEKIRSKMAADCLFGRIFFPGRTRPFIYTSGWSGQFRCQKSAPADLRSCRDFSGHHHGPDKKNSGGGGCVPAAATTTNVNNEQSGKRSQAQACGASGQGD